jgi:hypothetical protein
LPCTLTLPCGTGEFAVHMNFAVRPALTLPCVYCLPWVPLLAHCEDVFAVRCLTAMIGRTAAPVFPVLCLTRRVTHIYVQTKSKSRFVKHG